MASIWPGQQGHALGREKQGREEDARSPWSLKLERKLGAVSSPCCAIRVELRGERLPEGREGGGSRGFERSEPGLLAAAGRPAHQEPRMRPEQIPKALSQFAAFDFAPHLWEAARELTEPC